MEKPRKKFKILKLVLYPGGWLVAALCINLIAGKGLHYGQFSTVDHTFLVPILIGALFHAGLFYGNSLWLFIKYFKQKQWHWYLLYVYLFYTVSLVAESAIDYGLIRYYYPARAISANTFLFDIVMLEALGNAVILIASVAHAAVRGWLKNEFLKRKLMEEKLTTELAFLRTQINPHFLFNCLNNLYSLALREKIEETADGIAKLSTLMRYTLHDSNSGRVSLTKELGYIEDYLALQNLRIADEDDIFITFDIKGEVMNKELAPMLLIPFIENAFKHGLSLKAKTLIKILLEVTDEQLIFTVSNTINHTRKSIEEASGLGLANVKRRLELLYPEQHRLDIEKTDEEYKVRLVVSC